MSPFSDPKYPTRRAYVLKLRHDASADTLCGRLENIVTCRQGEFTSAVELFELIASDLDSSGETPDSR